MKKIKTQFIGEALAACAFFCLPLCALAQTKTASAAPAAMADAMAMGQYEASGARLGMPFPLALEAIASTKASWAEMIATQKAQAISDCAQSGRSIVYLSMSQGRLSASLDARCESAGGISKLREIIIKTKLAQDLAPAQVQAALSSRYGAGEKTEELAAGGFETVWQRVENAPFAPQGEALSARLESPSISSGQSVLTLKLTSRSLAGRFENQKGKAAESLPF